MPNCVIYVPFKGNKLLWHLAESDLGVLRERIKRKYGDLAADELDNIYEMYCHDETTHLLEASIEVCDHCGREATDDNPVFWSTDPYEDEISANPSGHVSLWCKECHHEACMDI